MTRVSIFAFSVAIVALASSSFAAPRKLLLPIFLSAPANGAYGSVWTTEFSVVNTGAGNVFLYTSDCDPRLCDVITPAIPNATRSWRPASNPQNMPGSFLYVDGASPADIHVTLRVQDTSRQSQTWGTVLPVVPDSSFRTERFSLLDVPLDDRFRTTLRIYGLDRNQAKARVRLYASIIPKFTGGQAADTLLGETTVTLPVTGLDTSLYPAYAQLDNLMQLSNAGIGGLSARVEIEPLDRPVWAMVSVTNNGTQHVTVIAPTDRTAAVSPAP